LLHSVSKELIDRFHGHVPDTLEELLSLKGVGLKTANLVLSEGFDQQAICVDTHVHRLSNLLGVVKTKTPDQTEAALRAVVPRKQWREWSRLLVQFGQSGGDAQKVLGQI
jgi:endonuclease-3